MKQIFILFFLALCCALRPAPAAHPPAEFPQNVILLIGDGMGLSQISLAAYEGGKALRMQEFPVTGLAKTHSARQRVTDSAAAATAMACGCKTYNGAIGVDAHKKPCTTLLEQAKSAGMATGLVTTSSITHATPAAFVAHVPRRAEYEEIAAFFTHRTLDLMIGGGLKYFTERKDKQNLCQALVAQGWRLSEYQQQPALPAEVPADQPFAWFSAWEEPPFASQGRAYLEPAAALSPAFLAQRSAKGFFLMIEGAQIDWAGHRNQADNVLREVQDFDAAVGAALDFAKKDGKTLVIVTADHETGGLALAQGNQPEELQVKFTTTQHTATLVPVLAFGPGAESFNGVYDNTDLYRKMQAALRLPPVQQQ
jgi:alkaline phosphatase